MSKKRISLVSALIFAALVLLFLSRFGGAALLLGAKNPGEIDDNKEGGYYRLEVSRIYAVFAEGGNVNEKAKARYAVIPYEHKLMAVRFPERYFASVEELMDCASGYIDGKNADEKYIVINGGFRACGEDLLSLMNRWIDGNKKALYNLELINESEDMEKIRYSSLFVVDSVNGVDAVFATAASVAALALIAAALLLIFIKEPENTRTPENIRKKGEAI